MIEVRSFNDFCLSCDLDLTTAVVSQFGGIQFFATFANQVKVLKNYCDVRRYFTESFDYLAFFQRYTDLIRVFFSNTAAEIGIPVLLYLQDKVRKFLNSDQCCQTEDDFFDTTSMHFEVFQYLSWLVAKSICDDYLHFIHNKV